MKKYSIQRLFELQFIMARYNFQDIAERVKKDEPLSKEDVKAILYQLRLWEAEFKYLNLKFTLKCLDDIRLRLMEPITFNEFDRELEVLSGRIEHELAEYVFGFIPKEKVEYFEHEALFGKEVNECFSSAVADIKHAGNCFAHEDYTATVFHLMRVAESGAKQLVRAMRVSKLLDRPIELCDWGKLIAAMEKGLKKLDIGSSKSTKKKDDLAFYSHAVGVFRNFKDAWRNNVAHSRKIYLEGETKDIMNNTRQFMQHLAQRLKEKV